MSRYAHYLHENDDRTSAELAADEAERLEAEMDEDEWSYDYVEDHGTPGRTI